MSGMCCEIDGPDILDLWSIVVYSKLLRRNLSAACRVRTCTWNIVCTLTYLNVNKVAPQLDVV